ncbi:O-antigen ligase family protein [Rhodococcus ruber]|uniref:O-antigen ligase family protein n=1 Tax=Rhodococcus ruber TaxID=1830 RepID=A0ABT4MAQ8_9NOCA|nr:O-antigen ligase family protein [Rhodococcus ruber]MCZ4518046.1 O-antigen ligase family protein [Rhodococcus ruber]
MGTLAGIFTEANLMTLVALVLALALAAAFGEAWARAARRRGGAWYLEAQIFVCGVLGPLSILFYTGGSTVFRFAVALGVISAFYGLKDSRRHTKLLTATLVAFYGTLLTSAYFGAFPAGVTEIPDAYWATPLIVISFVSHGTYTFEWLTQQIRWTLRIIVALSLVAIAMLPNAFNTDESRTLLGFSRLEGILPHPNAMAAVAGMSIVAELAHRRASWWLAPSLIALALAQSSTGWVGLVLAVPFLLGRLGKAFRISLLVIASSAALLYMAVPLIFADRVKALLPPNYQTLNGRTEIWEAAIVGGYRGNEVFGYGPQLLDDAFRAVWAPSFTVGGQAHNQIVQTLAGQGVLGLVALVAMLVVMVGIGLRFWREGGGLGMAATVLLVARMSTETPLRPTGADINTTLFVFTVAALVVSTDRVSVERDDYDETRAAAHVPSENR